MNLGDAIALSAAALAAFEAGDDAALLAELNNATIKVKRSRNGFTTLREAVDAVGESLATSFNLEVQKASDALANGTDAQKRQSLFLRDFREQFSRSDQGVDLSNETLRTRFAALLNQAGWTANQIKQILDLGSELLSPMQYTFDRVCVAQDITEYRARRDYDLLWLNNVQAPYNLGDRAAMVIGLRAVADSLEG
jgi:hypothetical protein